MRFTVDEPDPGLVDIIESDPSKVCHNGHEECSFRHGGPCSALPCTCETWGRCASCVPPAHIQP